MVYSTVYYQHALFYKPILCFSKYVIQAIYNKYIFKLYGLLHAPISFANVSPQSNQLDFSYFGLTFFLLLSSSFQVSSFFNSFYSPLSSTHLPLRLLSRQFFKKHASIYRFGLYSLRSFHVKEYVLKNEAQVLEQLKLLWLSFKPLIAKTNESSFKQTPQL